MPRLAAEVNALRVASPRPAGRPVLWRYIAAVNQVPTGTSQPQQQVQIDTLIAGGEPAGLVAALYLARFFPVAPALESF